MNAMNIGNEEDKPVPKVAFDDDHSGTLELISTGSKTIKYEHDKELTARLEREKLTLEATLAKKKAELDAKLEQEKEEKKLVRLQTCFRFFACWVMYIVCFVIFTFFSIWGDTAAQTWARPALLGMVGGIAGYAIGRAEPTERKN